MGSLRYAPAAKSSPVTPSFYVRNPEAHGLVSSSALSICSSTVNFCCSAHSPQLLKNLTDEIYIGFPIV